MLTVRCCHDESASALIIFKGHNEYALRAILELYEKRSCTAGSSERMNEQIIAFTVVCLYCTM